MAFPLQYAVSLAGSAVISNKHPSPKRFRSRNAPSYFEVFKKRKENNTRILHIYKRLSCDFTVGCSQQTITERLPFIKLISSGKSQESIDFEALWVDSFDDCVSHFYVCCTF